MARKYREGDEPVPGSGYRLTEFLGQGGFGEVWKATAPGGTEAALKIIALGGTEGRKEFRALQLVKRIRHTHLVPIFSFWLKNAEGQVIDNSLIDSVETVSSDSPPQELRATMAAPPYQGRPQATELIIAMGLGDKSLYDRLRECLTQGLGGIPTPELLHYLEDAAEAIDFLNRPLHDLGAGPVAIQHCDIKPHNLMIVGGGAQVCDFGLARMMGADRTTTAAASLAYAAPECLVEGKPSDSTDQYSLAVSYYELKTGTLPYQDENLAAVMDAKRQGTLDFSRLSEKEQSVLRRATSPHPKDRFPSSLAMVHALKHAAEEAESGEMPRSVPKTSNRKILSVGIVLLFLVLGVGTVGWFRGFLFFARHEPNSPLDSTVGPKEKTSRTQDASISTPSTVNHADTRPGSNPPSQDTNGNRSDALKELLVEIDRNLSNREWSLAREKCDKALQLDPRSAEAFFLRGRCYLNLTPPEYLRAIEDFEKAKTLSTDDRFQSHPDFAAALLGWGTEQLEASRFDEAITSLQKAAEANPKEVRIFSRLGAAWYAKKEWNRAVQAYSSAIQIQPDDARDFLGRGRAYGKLGQSDNAVADFERAATIRPQDPDVQLQLGTAYSARNEPSKAIAPLSKAIEAYADRPEKQGMLGSAYLLRGGAYFNVEPKNPAERLDSYRKALDDASQAARLVEVEEIASLISAHKLRASCFESLDRKSDANIDLKIVAALEDFEKNSEDADALNTVAYYLATAAASEIRNGTQAVSLATRACELTDWKNPEYLDTLATAYAECGQFDKAIEWEKKAIELTSNEKKAAAYRKQLERFEKHEK